jgi:copper chaperone NosL
MGNFEFPFFLFFIWRGRMILKSKLIVAFASLLLILTFFFPLWYIDLEAPQYPEGIGLEIWINKIAGQKPNDLENING